jgi:hypothetical protein
MKPPEFTPPADESSLLTRLTEEMARAEKALSVNFDMMTREVIYTDRVYYPIPALVSQHLFGGDAPRGDRAPDFAVTWPPASARFGRLVMHASEERLEARLFNFEAEQAEAIVRIWRFKAGEYRWTAGQRSGRLSVKHLPVDLNVAMDGRQEERLVVAPADAAK